MGETEFHRRIVNRSTLAADLRSIKRALGWLDDTLLPNPAPLVRFLQDFIDFGGSPHSLTILRHKALNKWGTRWMKAELRMYSYQSDSDALLRLYLTYADTASVPFPSVFEYTLSRIVAQRRFNITPSPYPKHIIWDRWLTLKAIIRLSIHLPWPLATITALFNSYIRALPDVISNRERKEVFSTFIWAFGECGAPDAAEGVLHAARAAGRLPDQRLYEVFAGVVAQAGNAARAFRLLKAMENGKSGQDPKLQVADPSGRWREVAQPRLATYGRIIEGFVKTGMLEQALKVEWMMKKSIPYRYGVNERLDKTMRALWALEVEEKLAEVS